MASEYPTTKTKGLLYIPKVFPQIKGHQQYVPLLSKILWSSLLVADTSTFVVFWNSLPCWFTRGVLMAETRQT